MNGLARAPIGWAVLAVCLLARAHHASAQNVALGKPIIDGSGSWQNDVFNGANFPARNVTDGSAIDIFASSYWLGREGMTDEYFTLDLQAVHHVDRIELRNTHNTQYFDRSTGEFVIFGATAVDASNQLINPFPLLSGTLTVLPPGGDPAAIIPIDSFTSANGLNSADARYLKFETISSGYGNNNVGLNEISVYDLSVVNPNLAFNKPVIESSGSYGDLPGFAASHVTDGSISDSSQNYWLGREGVTNEHLTIDLGTPTHIAEIDLRNTHNSQSGDGGTRDFQILAGNAVDANNQIINPTVILQSKLSNTAGQSVIQPNVFTSANGLAVTDARYLRFEAISSTYSGNVGLNELEVYNSPIHAPTVMRDNVALNKPVIDGNGAWNMEAFNAGSYPAQKVTDGSVADSNGGNNSYWLGQELMPDQYFTVDLQGVYHINEIDLRNAHNTQYNDRGTQEFFILGAMAVDENNQLVDPFLVLSGTLSNVSGQEIITPDVFTDANGLQLVNARYLQFHALSFVDPVNGFGGAGLNELEVYGTLVPEPSTLFLMSVGAIGLAWAGKRRRDAR